MDRSNFILSRTEFMSTEDFRYFETCKEEKLYTERFPKPFINFIRGNSCLSLDSLINHNEVIQLISYIWNCLIKDLYEKVIRQMDTARNEYLHNYTIIDTGMMRNSVELVLKTLRRKVNIVASKLGIFYFFNG